MTDQAEIRRNGPLRAGWLLLLLAILSLLVVFFVQLPGQGALPWINLLLFALALACSVMAVRRAFGQPQTYRGKVTGSILLVLTVLLTGLSAFGFYHAREVPSASGAPQVGQKAPDFTLPDINGAPVSLSGLLSRPMSGAPGGHPKAVLLIFYRGYW